MLWYDEVFHDLAAAAERAAKTAAERPVEGRPKRLYKGDAVEVVAEDPSSARSRWKVTWEGDDESGAFWVSDENLRPLPASRGGEVHHENTTRGGFDDLAAHCKAHGYRLWVMLKPTKAGDERDPLQEAEDQYFEWSGEPLPEEGVDDQTSAPGKAGTFPTEWRCVTVWVDGMPCPVDIDRAGTPGKGSTSKPRGLRTDNGRHIFFNYTSTVAALVGAGLRAGMDWHKD